MARALLALTLVAVTVALATSAAAWSDFNCRALCRKVSADAHHAEACIQRVRCERYRGRRHADSATMKRVEARWRAWNGLDGTYRWRQPPSYPNTAR